MKRYLGIDIGGTHVKYGVYSETGESLSAGGELPSVRDDFDKILSILTEIISEFPDIDGIGLSVPGGVDKHTGIISAGGACVALDQKDLRGILRERFQRPVSIENDANCAILAELWLGNGRDCETFICVTIGTGIGGGLVIDGKLHAGSHSFAGEFGCMIMDTAADGYVTLSDTGATSILLAQIKERTASGITTGKALFEALDQAEVKAVYDNWVRELAKGIYNVAVGIDPDKILIGGGISAQPRLIADINTVLADMKQYDFQWTAAPCLFGNDAGKIGAIYKLITTEGNAI
ncbi:MAG: ROK family protein [Oscillospiraceae bacterium]|nr:ROK family protein [Oscillospiraceae bacterium]